ncbi:MAG: hypothetical protein KDB27_32625 [Planctomycetales bacterium]|nr:hypothetical protein [Planctomycetales bacterium]
MKNYLRTVLLAMVVMYCGKVQAQPALDQPNTLPLPPIASATGASPVQPPVAALQTTVVPPTRFQNDDSLPPVVNAPDYGLTGPRVAQLGGRYPTGLAGRNAPSSLGRFSGGLGGSPRQTDFATLNTNATTNRTQLGTPADTSLRQLRPASVIGDFFGSGAGRLTLTSTSSFYVPGVTVIGAGAGATLAFELDGTLPFNDFFTNGPGKDLSGDTRPDTFPIAEPVPPTDAPTAPGPTFTFNGGTVVFTRTATGTTPVNGDFADFDQWLATYDYTLEIEVPSSVGIAVRRIKIAENNSPLPRNRYYFDMKHFRDVKGPFGDVSRFAYGFEKTFWNGLASLDTRLPFAATLDSTQSDTSGDIGIRAVEFGNVSLISKFILWESDRSLYAGGLGVSVPTGSDSRLLLSNGTPVLIRENQAVHLMPYVAGLWTPTDRFYWQAFLQVDVDVNGDPVMGNVNGGVLPKIGQFQDSTLLFADVSAGYWLLRDLTGQRTVRGLAAVSELHYNTSVTDADVAQSTGILFTDNTRRFDVINATLGLHAEIGNAATLTGGMTFPLRTGDDRQFDNEVAAQFNVYF